MKSLLLILTVVLLAGAVFAADEIDRKPRVTVTMRDGKSGDFKLDWIDEKQVIVYERDTLKVVKLDRQNVLSISFGDDKGGRFKMGEEGFVLNNGTVVLGHPTSMDKDTFWIIPAGTRKEDKADRSKVIFIQFEKREIANPGSGGNIPPGKTLSAKVILVASQQWADTGLNVEAGQKIWFTVSDQETIGCGAQAPKVNADGADPYSLDQKRPMPDVKSCALIAKVGNGGTLFRVGLNATPFTAKESGRIMIGLNDYDFRDNVGQFTVYVKTGY